MPRPILIAGGGTGGHVFPMVAVAEALLAAGVPADGLRFVGSRRGQEQRLGSLGVPLTRLPGRGFRRSVRPRAFWQNAGAAGGLGAAVLAAVLLHRRWRPRAVVSLGGYAAVAPGLAAVLWRTPLIVVDFDVAPGATHRALGRFAAVRCGAFASPGVVVTGAPLRAAILAVCRAPVATRRERGARWRITVMTGSLGARSVNLAVVDLASRWRDRDDVAIRHVTGERDAALCAARWQPRPADRLEYAQEPFGDMATAWASCDLAVCRAGAGTVAELTALGVPSVLIPLPGAPGDHQRANAAAVVAAGGAVLVEDGVVDGATLARTLEPLLDVAVLAAMEVGARSLGRTDGAVAIAREVLAVARG